MVKKIRLYWAGGHKNNINFGDTLSPLVVEMLSGRQVQFASPSRCDIVAIGSLLDKVASRKFRRYFNFKMSPIKVWGTGSFSASSISRLSNLEIFALRGPLTRSAIGLDDSVPLGDPGLLIDRFEIKSKKTFRWGIIPHYLDLKLPSIKEIINHNKNSTVIDLTNPNLFETMKNIQGCDFIISSSLHGIIAADALNIPNIWMSVSNNVQGANWKFNDYFLSVGRGMREPIKDKINLSYLEGQANVADRKKIEKCKLDLEAAFKRIYK